ncbi:hypothetical protein [Mesorhizobium sp.]|uniref:hypothetical protein n=1 Tax=Mesorhizobium sp. TaxID=1871066 RepID=UPI0025CF038B|nr:hypothetical protein [Mesorhizobium sp.]
MTLVLEGCPQRSGRAILGRDAQFELKAGDRGRQARPFWPHQTWRGLPGGSGTQPSNILASD